MLTFTLTKALALVRVKCPACYEFLNMIGKYMLYCGWELLKRNVSGGGPAMRVFAAVYATVATRPLAANTMWSSRSDSSKPPSKPTANVLNLTVRYLIPNASFALYMSVARRTGGGTVAGRSVIGLVVVSAHQVTCTGVFVARIKDARGCD